jgi:hypothetical protein
MNVIIQKLLIMKRIVKFSFLFILSIAPFIIHASDPPKANFGIYGIQHHNTLSEYQKYIGQTVIYIPKESPTYEDKTMFMGEFNKKYIITKISGDDLTMTFLLTEKGGKKKVNMVIYNENKYPVRGKSYFFISELYSVPLLLIDKFDNDKSNLIGKLFTNDKVITEYECVDVIMKAKKKEYSFSDEPYPTPHYVLKSSISGELKTYPAENVETECFSEDISGEYKSTLIKVEKPIDESIRYGETKVLEVEGVTKYRYIDDFIDILILGESKQFSFILKNISSNTLKLVWDEAVFVDFIGTSSKVMHVGILYSQRDATQPASTIIKDAHIEDVAVPTCNVRYSDIQKEWITDSMYPNTPATTPGDLKLMLPIQVKEVINEYTFIFRVDWVFNHPELLRNKNLNN